MEYSLTRLSLFRASASDPLYQKTHIELRQSYSNIGINLYCVADISQHETQHNNTQVLKGDTLNNIGLYAECH
jgi:hypothetical protein